MPLLLPLTDTAISDCRNLLLKYRDTDPIDPAIVSYLTRHVNGLLCAEIELVVSLLIKERIQAGCSDDAASNFLGSSRRNLVRNAKYSEISDKLGLLGETYKSRFREAVESEIGDEGIQKLGIAVGNRDNDAHHTPPDITFGELEEVFSIATSIVDAVERVLQS